MKTLLKSLSMIAICLMTSIQLSSCSSDDDTPSVKGYTAADLVGEWSVSEVDPIRPEILDNETALKFPTPFIEFEADGKMNWHEWILLEARPSEEKLHGSFSVKDDKLTIQAPGNAWMNGTHTIVSLDKPERVMVLLVETSLYKVRVILTPSYYDL